MCILGCCDRLPSEPWLGVDGARCQNSQAL